MSYPSEPKVAAGARITFSDKTTLSIDGLQITDPELIETIREWGRTHPRGREQAIADVPGFVAWLLSLGARTYSGGKQSTSAGLIAAAASEAGKSISMSASAVSDQMVRASGDLHDVVTTEVTRLVEEIAEMFGSAESPAATVVQESLKTAASGMALDLAGRLESAVTATVRTGLDGLRGEVRSVGETVTSVREHLLTAAASDSAAAAVTMKSSVKGVEFEDEMNTVMDDLAVEASREYLATGTQQGHAVGTGSSLKGDGVWIHDGYRVAVEFHNGMSRSKHGDTHQQGWSRYLSEAMKNRDATAALGVVASPEQNKGRSVRGLGTNMVVMSCDPSNPSDVDRLRFMMVVMEMVARNHEGRNGSADGALTRTDLLGASVLAVRRCLDEFKNGLDTVSTLEKQASRTESSAVQLRETAFSLRAQLAGSLSRALAETSSQTDLLGLTVAVAGSDAGDEEDFEVVPGETSWDGEEGGV